MVGGGGRGGKGPGRTQFGFRPGLRGNCGGGWGALGREARVVGGQGGFSGGGLEELGASKHRYMQGFFI